MTCENIKNWLKSNTDIGNGISCGGIDGNKEQCIGVYPAKGDAQQRICLGGAAQTRTQIIQATILVHWTKSFAQSEEKANEIYSLFYGLSSADMDGVHVCMADPGGAPIYTARDAHGICEFVINIKIIYLKE